VGRPTLGWRRTPPSNRTESTERRRAPSPTRLLHSKPTTETETPPAKPNQIPSSKLQRHPTQRQHKDATQRRTRNLKKATGDHTAFVAPSSKNSTLHRPQVRIPGSRRRAAFVTLPTGSSASRSPVHSTAAPAPAAGVGNGEEIHPGRGLLFCFFW
jgi:hypothetical protein